MLFMIFNRINAMKWKRGEETAPLHRPAHFSDFRCDFVCQEVTAKSRFCALRVFEFNNTGTLNRVLTNAEQAGSKLRDHMIGVRDQRIRISSFACGHEGA